MRKVKIPTLKTDRLILRMWSRRDAGQLYEYAKDPDVGPRAGWKPHDNEVESRTIIDRVFLVNSTWAIVEKETNTVIGSIGLERDKLRPDINSREMGYSLAKSHWGKGYMTEAARQIIRYAFDDLKLDVLMVRTNETNHGSQKVISKCGFFYEGTLRQSNRNYDGSIRSVQCYSMLAEEYKKLYESLS